MKSIGIVGTAKNTGKTTTLSYLMNGLRERKKKLAFTSIGYDGEEIDNITNLPKPRLFFQRGDVIATSEKCLISGKINYELINKTQFRTALGEILIVRLLSPAKVVLAGPNTAEGLKSILEQIKLNSNTDYVFVDGSMNRLSPMYYVDKLIFTTGAARNTNVSFLVDEMKIIEKVFSYPSMFSGIDKNLNRVTINSNEKTHNLNLTTLIDEEDFEIFLNQIERFTKRIYLDGLVSVKLLQNNFNRLIEKTSKPLEFILKSPLHLMFGDNLFLLQEFLSNCEKHSIIIAYKLKPELSAITLNPFYPKYDNYIYSPSFIDKQLLISEMRKSLSTPVFNVFESEAENIFELI